ncbi:DUF3293 domain-containing protein [Paracraurococcus lichenis]|uniref:DUF3293 domain-containing protein n=1 Tax=Paracraurococcus lichenis TaxID=3064888 RepID=A0ABT9DTH8_9PROT|nr:DUF3293 domain-containing protein [Paracraurococcus sp. LOR1-02]MDO9707195.1 DUF3293 domain-containing protein [Paracraurococcus sp. LOR1-02]
MSVRLHRAYRRSRYEAAGAVARIGGRSPAVDALLRRLGARAGGFVTAWNPASRRMPPGWNRRMLPRLRAAARRLPMAEGWGGDGPWREWHLLLGGDPRRVAVLARRFRQAAIVTVRRGAPARLVLLRPAP